MQKQGNGESVVHNKPEYADVQCYDALLILYTSVTKLCHKGGRSLTQRKARHRQTREKTQQLIINISLEIFIKTIQ